MPSALVKEVCRLARSLDCTAHGTARAPTPWRLRTPHPLGPQCPQSPLSLSLSLSLTPQPPSLTLTVLSLSLPQAPYHTLSYRRQYQRTSAPADSLDRCELVDPSCALAT